MTIPINLTEISTFEWSENEKSVTKPPFFEASSRHVALNMFLVLKLMCTSECISNVNQGSTLAMAQWPGASEK